MEIPVSSISFAESKMELTVGEMIPLDPVITPDNATNKKLSWSSSKDAVATVTAHGIVEAISAGTAFITATSENNGVNAKCEIIVKEKVVAVTGIALNKTSVSLSVGEEFTLMPTITPDNATNKDVEWKSDNEAVASVSSEGVVKALRAGKANITATTVDQAKTAACAVEVNEGMGAVTGEASHISCCNAQLSGKVNLPQTTSTDLNFGVLYSTSSGVLLGSAILLQAKQFDAEYNFTVETGVLEPETIYYYRSYIIQNDKVEYGQIQSFTTLAVSSLIQTLDAGSINPKDATLNASLNLTDCRYESIEYGFKLTPEGGYTTTLISDNHADNSFSYQANLKYNTKYTFIAYVKLDDKVYKGEPETFSTPSIQASVTAEASDVKSKSAKISGSLNIQSEGSFSKSAVLYFSSSESTLEGLWSNGTRETLTLGSDGSYSKTLSALTLSTAYNFVVVAWVEDVSFASQIGSFSTLEYPIPSQVDLGLSVKWASCNLGESQPTEYGGYYQWAGTKDVSDQGIDLYWDNCPYHTGSDANSSWLKYNTKPSYGKVDNKTVLEAKDDAANVALGGNWRIPTDEEWAELSNTDNCSWTWTTIDGVSGYKVQSKKSGYTDKWIFLPAAGHRYGIGLSIGFYGYYWSSSLNTDNPDSANGMFFSPSDVSRSYKGRYYGMSIRPVSE